jgi:predicted anti-sigma-YlaC factor YlaD
MSCEEADYLLDIRLDGELDLSRRVELEQHLSQCLSCQLILRERQEFRTFFSTAVPRFEARPELRAEILANVRSDQAKQNFTSSRSPC